MCEDGIDGLTTPAAVIDYAAPQRLPLGDQRRVLRSHPPAPPAWRWSTNSASALAGTRLHLPTCTEASDPAAISSYTFVRPIDKASAASPGVSRSLSIRDGRAFTPATRCPAVRAASRTEHRVLLGGRRLQVPGAGKQVP